MTLTSIESLRETLRPQDGDDWRAEALCAEVDPEIFYPEKGQSTREAKRLCLTCSVSEQCLQYALRNNEDAGIWGGTSPQERKEMRRWASVA